jgi:hypothetical protein
MLSAPEPAAAMTRAERHRSMEAARVHAGLSVQNLWLRYLALSGSGDAFDIDGYLQGIMPLEPFQENILAQALTEALSDSYDTYRATLAAPAAPDAAEDEKLHVLIRQILNGPPRSGTGAGQ